MAKSNKASKLKLNKLGNAKNALELRKKGLNYAEIAEKLEISKTHAHRLVMEAMLDLDEQVKDQAEKLRSLEISRLDSLVKGLWAKAKKGDVLAVDRVLKIMERRSKFLGLDAPVKLAHGGDKSMDAINIDINELTNESLQNIAQASCD